MNIDVDAYGILGKALSLVFAWITFIWSLWQYNDDDNKMRSSSHGISHMSGGGDNFLESFLKWRVWILCYKNKSFLPINI